MIIYAVTLFEYRYEKNVVKRLWIVGGVGLIGRVCVKIFH
jgi:hypothetical protein